MIPLKSYGGRGFFITGTGTDIGKTTATAALASALHHSGVQVGLCKPFASGCPKYPGRGNDHDVPLADDDLMPLDSLLPAQCVGMDVADEALLRHLSPVRYAAPVAPRLASQVERRSPNWARVAGALEYWEKNCAVLLVEGAGGWLTPLDEADHSIADLAASLRLPVIVVTTPHMGSINMSVLTVESIRHRGLEVAGLIFNRVPSVGRRDLNVLDNLHEIPRLAGATLLGSLPELGAGPVTAPLPQEMIDPLVAFAKRVAGDGLEYRR